MKTIFDCDGNKVTVSHGADWPKNSDDDHHEAVELAYEILRFRLKYERMSHDLIADIEHAVMPKHARGTGAHIFIDW